MECNQSFIEVLMSRNTAAQIRRCVWTLFFMGVTLSAPLCFGQRFVQPSYTPSSTDAYFSGDSNRVFPNPFQKEFTPFKSEPGDSKPIPDREVRQKNRAERREKFLKRFGGSKNEENEEKERSASSSKVVYPDKDRRGRNTPPSRNPMLSPAPFVWNEDERSLNGEITEALPFNDPDDVSAQIPPSTQPIYGQEDNSFENDFEEESDLLLEDVTIPAAPKLQPKDSGQSSPEFILEDVTSAPREVPSKAGKNPKLTAETKDSDLLDLDIEELVPTEPTHETRRQSLHSRRLGAKQAPKAENDETPENPETLDDSDESIDLILEPVPETSDSRKEHSILQTTQILQDSSVQPAAFFSPGSGSQNTVQYPVRKKSSQSGTSSWPSFPWSENQKKTTPETKSKSWDHSSVESPSRETAEPRNSVKSPVSAEPTVSAGPQSVLSEAPKSGMQSVLSPEVTDPTPKESFSILDDSASKPVQQKQNPAPRNTNSPAPEKQPKAQTPAQTQWDPLASASAPKPEQDVPTYNPPFPERSAPTSRLEMTQPIREVFKDFGIRKTVEKSALPWYAQYIRDLDVNEEHLFNSLRVLGNAKLSQSQCQFTLMEASIIASQPKTAAEANRLLNIYENIEYGVLQRMRQVDARTELTTKQKEELKAEFILDFMHQKVFVKYVLEGTTINNLLEHGYYNCVTASLLFCSLAEKAGLNVTAVELPGHAMCWVYLSDGERLEVETTCGNWFKYRNDPETQQKVICKLIRDASPQLKDQSDKMLLLQVPQPISDKRLIAKIYYNRGVDLLSSGDYAGALEANAIAYCLDLQSETTFGNLLATMNNWAIALCREGKYEEATALLREGLRHQPNYPPFKNNHTHVYHHWVDSLYRNGQMNEALHVAAVAASEQPDVDHFKRLQEQIEQNIALANQNTSTR